MYIHIVDAFLRERGSNDHESTALIKAQFMSLWDGLATDKNSKVLIMGATNRPLDVDPAFRRRMPCMLQIGKPVSDAFVYWVWLNHQYSNTYLQTFTCTMIQYTITFSQFICDTVL